MQFIHMQSQDYLCLMEQMDGKIGINTLRQPSNSRLDFFSLRSYIIVI